MNIVVHSKECELFLIRFSICFFHPILFTICCGNSSISPLLCDLSKNIVFAPFPQGPHWSVKSHVPRKWPQVRVFPLVHSYLPAPWSSTLITQSLGSLLPWQLYAGQLVLVPWEGGSFSSPSSGPACPLLGYAGLNPSYWPGSQQRQRGQLLRAGLRGAGLSCRERPLQCLPAQAECGSLRGSVATSASSACSGQSAEQNWGHPLMSPSHSSGSQVLPSGPLASV